jgi:hypothetical protein
MSKKRSKKSRKKLRLTGFEPVVLRKRSKRANHYTTWKFFFEEIFLSYISGEKNSQISNRYNSENPSLWQKRKTDPESSYFSRFFELSHPELRPYVKYLPLLAVV